MKKILSLALITMLTLSLFAKLQKQSIREKLRAVEIEVIQQRISRSINNAPPQWVMENAPVDLTPNYYDYAPGSYNKSPIKVQPLQGGVYMVYHGRESAASTRRIWASYVDASGVVTETGTHCSTNDVHEGYPGMDIDAGTGDPFVAWHANTDGDANYEIPLTFDQYHIIWGPSLWATAYPIFDNSEPGNYPLPHPLTDEFLWPQVEVTPSPTEGLSRIWVMGNNAGSNGTNPGSNIVLGYTDTDVEDIWNISNLTWTWVTLPELDAMDVDGDNWNRAFLSLIASSDGSKIAVVGHTLGSEGDSQSPVVFLNENYGEGDFTYYHTDFDGEYGDWRFFVDNPLNNFEEGELYISYSQAGHFSADFVGADDEKILFAANMGLQTIEDTWYPNLLSVKSTTFDLISHEFDLKDITPIRYNDDGTKLLPDNTNSTPNTWWDVDEDGEIDVIIYIEGEERPSLVSEYPIYHPNTDNGFHYNTTKIAVNKENNLVAAVWSDATMAKFATDYPDDPDYASWANSPEIVICVSSDNGSTWSEPLKLNGNSEDVNSGSYVGGFVDELEGMIPSFVYPSQTIEDVQADGEGNLWGTIHFMFLDETTYGSEIIINDPATGGMMKYMALRLNFGEPSQIEPTAVINVPNIVIQPNDTATVEIATTELLTSSNYISYQFTLTYDPEIVEYQDYGTVGTLSENAEVAVNSNTPGELIIGAMSTTPFSGEGSLIQLNFEALTTGFTELVVSDFTYNSDPITVNDGSIVVTNVVYGNINYEEDDVITSFDAILTLQYSVELDPLPIVDPIPWEEDRILAAEVSGEGIVNSYDAALILQYSVGIIDIFPVETREQSPLTHDITISIEDGYFVFEVDNDMIGFSVTTSEENIDLGTPEILNWSNTLSYLNEENNYHFGIASTESASSNVEFLRIPFSNAESNEITFEVSANGDSQTITVPNVLDNANNQTSPLIDTLVGNYPNPFNPTTTISYSVANENNVEIAIYNIKGQKVKTLINQVIQSGDHSISWNGNDSSDTKVSSGIYFCKTRIGEKEFIKKMILMK